MKKVLTGAEAFLTIGGEKVTIASGVTFKASDLKIGEIPLMSDDEFIAASGVDPDPDPEPEPEYDSIIEELKKL